MLRDVYRYLVNEKIDSLERMAAAWMATMFQEVFRSGSYAEAEGRFEGLLDSYLEMPYCLRRHVDKVMMGFDRYTAYLRGFPLISKTSNPVEDYRQTSPEKVKRIYKSSKGVLKCLWMRAGFWAIRHGLISAETSRFIGHRFMGKRFAELEIQKLFSKRKRHYITYWAGQPPTI